MQTLKLIANRFMLDSSLPHRDKKPRKKGSGDKSCNIIFYIQHPPCLERPVSNTLGRSTMSWYGGNRRENSVLGDDDRWMFLHTLGEMAGRTSILIHAFALMDNHYHLVIETPRANLVDGMQWFQNTYTRRFNVKHKVWGHLFGGRYKAVLVQSDEGDYFSTLTDYVHLTPVRAGMIRARL